MKPHFDNYSLDDLLEVKEVIDRLKYPERYLEICNLIKLREKEYLSQGIPNSNKKLMGLKEICQYFKTGIYTRLSCFLISVIAFYLFAQYDPTNIFRAKLLVVVIVGLGGIFYPWSSDDNET
jgi:hypothetical protein